MRASAAVAVVLMAPLGGHADDGLPVPEGADEGYGFFDYLGEMVEDDDGEWVDPLAMDTLAVDTAGQGEDDDGQPLAPGEGDDE